MNLPLHIQIILTFIGVIVLAWRINFDKIRDRLYVEMKSMTIG